MSLGLSPKTLVVCSKQGDIVVDATTGARIRLQDLDKNQDNLVAVREIRSNAHARIAQAITAHMRVTAVLQKE